MSLAIKTATTCLTYRELWKLLEDQVIELSKLPPHTVVTLECPKGPDFVVKLLACWKAGLPPVIINAEWPAGRINKILKQAQPSARLQKQGLTICQNYARDWPPNLAYLIFSSGSSGKPKGTLVPHDGILAMLEEQVERFHINANSSALWLHQVEFDASLSDIGTALLAGACLCIPNTKWVDSLEQFYQELAHYKPSHIDIPPALLNELDHTKMPSNLETLIVGGEVSNKATIREWSKHFRLLNVYGPTEATVCTSIIDCTPDWDSDLIGPPMRHTNYLVLDPDQPKNSKSTKGELIIYGKSVALGYLEQSTLSKKKFASYEGQRSFHTGDLVKQLPNGSLEFLGRIDRQSKINGKLFSPEEVERHLLEIPQIKECYVNHLQGVIHACIVSHRRLEIGMLTNQLSTILPPWMIPHSYSFVKSLPRLNNRKLNYQAILPVDQANTIATTFCSWMRRAIPLNTLTVNDNFFTSGGDSLSALRFLSIAQEQGLSIQPESLQQAPTARALAETYKKTTSYRIKASILNREVTDQQTLLTKNSDLPNKNQTPLQSRTLLTGATGFLGSAILGELGAVENFPRRAKRPNREIWCLVRGDIETQKKRIREKLKAHGYDPSMPFHVIKGDLTKENLGWSESEIDQWAEYSWQIIHSAAEVHMLKSYKKLRNVNLAGTRRILELLNRNPHNKLSYLSTLSVFVDAQPCPSICRETDELDQSEEIFGGYAQSKWAAERLITQHNDSKARSQIIRLGLLTPNSSTGYGADNDWFKSFVRGINSSRNTPSGSMDFSPVDITAKRTVSIIETGKLNNIYHIANAEHLSTKILVEASSKLLSAENPYQHLQGNTSSYTENSTLSILKTNNTEFCCQNTKEVLGIKNLFPSPSLEYVKNYLQKL